MDFVYLIDKDYRINDNNQKYDIGIIIFNVPKTQILLLTKKTKHFVKHGCKFEKQF